MSKILGTGIATLDIINHVDHYPHEDEEMRADAQRIARGGNTANTLEVLAQFGHQCHFCGTLADDRDSLVIEHKLSEAGIETHSCQRISGGHAPTSYITLNRQNGSRTIVHFRDLPELNAEHFLAQAFNDMDWFHFEGRNISATLRMLQHTHAIRTDQPISIEFEKDRPDIDGLVHLGDVLIFSHTFVTARGFDNAEAFMHHMRNHNAEAMIICPWGDKGAWGMDRDNRPMHSPVSAPEQVVDTLGAGDCFNAGLIHALSSGMALADALSFSNRLAGAKVAQQGLAGLGRVSLQ
jgi:ketohexokinase